MGSLSNPGLVRTMRSSYFSILRFPLHCHTSEIQIDAPNLIRIILIVYLYHPQSVLGAALSGEDVELAEFLDLFLYCPFRNAEVIG